VQAAERAGCGDDVAEATAGREAVAPRQPGAALVVADRPHPRLSRSR
jgi:hypothetical protein